jgi:hypothetical protein
VIGQEDKNRRRHAESGRGGREECEYDKNEGGTGDGEEKRGRRVKDKVKDRGDNG